jgi:hypothetical protein
MLVQIVKDTPGRRLVRIKIGETGFVLFRGTSTDPIIIVIIYHLVPTPESFVRFSRRR